MAITKYGPEAFVFELIATCRTQEDVDYLEVVVIEQYDSRNKKIGYNIDAGGNSSPRTPEICQKISDGLNRFYAENESCRLGAILPEEWKQKISESHMGLPGTNLGKTFDEEWVMAISRSQAGKEKKAKRKFLEEVEKEICRRYVEEEKSTYLLGQEFNCQRTTIADILKRNDIETRRSSYTGHKNGRNIFTLEQEEEMCVEYKLGKISRTELARKYECGRTTMRDILLRHNIKL